MGQILRDEWGVMIFDQLRQSGKLWRAIVLCLVLSPPAYAAEDDDRPLLSVDELPAELSLVISASVLSMRGEDDPEAIWPVDISSEAAAGLKDPGFAYEDFRLVGAGLRDWGVASQDPLLYNMSVLLVFADQIGRRATVMLVADYGFSEKNLEIKNAAALTMAPPNPESRIFVVPAKDFPASLLDAGSGAVALFRNVAERAIGVGGGSAPSTPEDYYVFAFVLDRLPADSQFRLQVSDQSTGLDGGAGNSVTTDFSGWRVAVLRGEFSLGSGPELFFKTVYTPGARESEGAPKARLAGVFSSHGLSKARGR